jgi:hypothetical protein
VARAIAGLLFLLFLPHGCSDRGSKQGSQPGPIVNRRTPGPPTQTLAVYEAWFGHPRHISVGYSSQDPAVLRKQIRRAKAVGISGFVVDWYGYREPLIDHSYSLLQTIAAKEKFHVAMMYDETDDEEGATDEAIEDFKLFEKTYLSADAPGRQAYLTYNGRPVIFIFPKAGHTDWSRVRAEVNKWTSSPLLINEYPPGKFAEAIDGYYAWVSPGQKGWTADGSNWGEEYLQEYYQTMESKYPEKIAVGGVWAGFDDSKASWSLNRHMSARDGQTLADTCKLFHQYSPHDNPLPFLFVETWNDYEEGTAVEQRIPTGARSYPCPSP